MTTNLMTAPSPLFDAVLFDCDGVLVDSEPITHSVLRDVLEEAGWAMTLEESMAIFLGKAVRDERAQIEARTGKPLTDAWMRAFYARRDERLRAELQPMPGAVQAVAQVHALVQGRIACASGADRAKVLMQLHMAGMAPHFGERVFSGHDLPRSKPAPDVYLVAAQSVGVAPARCLVIEDTPTGVRAGLAAGATVWGYCPQGHGRAFEGLPVARVFHHMAQLPALLASVSSGHV